MIRRSLLAACAAGLVLGAGCGHSGTSSGSSPSTPAGVIRVGSEATSKADSVGFEMKLGLTLHGNLSGSGPAGALLQGPLSLELKGHSATRGSGKADVHFALNFSGGSLSGELLTPDGKTGYVQLPSVLGPGWHSFPLNSSGGSGGAPADPSALLGRVRPVRWLTNMHLSKSGDTDTVSAALDVPRMLSDLSSLSGQASAAQLGQARSAVREATGSISYDRSTHLPSAFQAALKVVVPPALASGAQGVRGVDLQIDSTFSDWGDDFSVERPAGATPIAGLGPLGGTLGGV